MALGVIEPRPNSYSRGETLGSIIANAFRLILPVTFLLASYLAALLLLDQPVWFSWGTDNPAANPAEWMSMGHLLLLVSFFIVMLTNRAYGAGLATVQVIAAWIIILGVAIAAGSTFGMSDIHADLPAPRVGYAFLAAVLLGHFTGIWVFDGQRGVPWIKAPLLASLIGPGIFGLVFFPSAYMGSEAPWGEQMGVFLAIVAMAAVAAMVPYFLMRGFVRPGPGLGGA